MTENNTDSKMAVESNTALKEALRAQQQLLQKLYNELDVEREASATAASEALAMILRLQGEKASVKMEAEHYKRLSEEKMYHAEESMEIFEEIIHQKEMEIISLDCQVQAYRYKLASLGFEDIEANEIKFPENLLNDTSVLETSPESLLRRNSAPPKLLKLAYLKRNNLERKRSISPDSDTILKTVEDESQSQQTSDLEKETTEGSSSSVSINSYWDQIRKLDKIVEEMGGDEYSSIKGRSSKSSSVNETYQTRTVKKVMDDEILSDTCVSVYDVFEVPETNEIVIKDNGKSIFKDEKKVEELVTFTEEDTKLFDKAVEKTLLLKHKDKELFFPKDGIVVDCHMAMDQPTTYVAESQSQGSTRQVNVTTEITEGERQDVISQEEVLRLLNEINGKLDSIQSEIRSGKKETKKQSLNYDLPMLQLSEAMLHFWL